MSRPPGTSSFVGRERELDVLRDALGSAVDGRGRLVLVAGEAGIGKTRLAEQLALEARARGARVLIGRCYEGEGAPAYWPWVMVLRDLVASADLARAQSWLGGNVAAVAQVVPEVAAGAGSVVTLPELAADGVRFRFFDAVATVLARAAADAPLLVLLDDLHWADGGSLRLLHFAVGQLARTRVLFIGAHRDVEMRLGPESAVRAELARAGERLALGGLDAGDVAGLVRAMLAGDPPPGFSERVHSRSAHRLAGARPLPPVGALRRVDRVSAARHHRLARVLSAERRRHTDGDRGRAPPGARRPHGRRNGDRQRRLSGAARLHRRGHHDGLHAGGGDVSRPPDRRGVSASRRLSTTARIRPAYQRAIAD